MSDQSVILNDPRAFYKNMYSEAEVNDNKMKHMSNNIEVKLIDQDKQSIECV